MGGAQGNVDGAYFGTTFPHLLLMTYPSLRPSQPTENYTPRVFGADSSFLTNCSWGLPACPPRHSVATSSITGCCWCMRILYVSCISMYFWLWPDQHDMEDGHLSPVGACRAHVLQRLRHQASSCIPAPRLRQLLRWRLRQQTDKTPQTRAARQRQRRAQRRQRRHELSCRHQAPAWFSRLE